ncbi:hypothetical protein M433DRAFT_21743 [Acidomyces richmondensis BFW]|nr:MAG: hypothetical protein FE78DRAFT_26367 [Acidomyces sp. 'richmondensis']KYG48977.1 hypothetical protein M433DRAFT_21743 [Acidomyces richmondensis BFW]
MRELRKLTNNNSRKIFGLYRHFSNEGWLTFKQAHALLANVNAKPFTEEQTIARMRLRRAFNIAKEDMNPDLFIRITRDLDIVLFGGQLDNRVLISWERLPKLNGMRVAGFCSEALWRPIGLRKAYILLNKEIFFDESKE